MKTTVNINLSGQSFVIDDDAFQHLSVYLNNIKSRFKSEAEGKEVLEDIEARIAELFISKSSVSRSVVGMSMVEEVIAKLGKPEDIFMEDETESAESNRSASSQSTGYNKVNRRLFRNPDDKMISGLASGLSAYFGIHDPTWMRIIFVIAGFASGGTFILIYLGLSAIVPLAETASDKLQMRGEDVNLNNIKKTVQSGMSRGADIAVSTGQRIIDGIVDVIKSVFKFLAKVFSLFGILISVCLLFGVIMTFIMMEIGSMSELSGLIFDKPMDSHLSSFGIFLFAGIPFVAIIYFSLRGMLGGTARIAGLSWVLFGLWMMGLTLVSYESIHTGKQFSKQSSIVKSETLNNIMGDTLILSANEKQELQHNGVNFNLFTYHIDGFAIQNGTIYMESAGLNITKGTDKVELISTQLSQGVNDEEAHNRANHISNHYSLNKNTLLVDNFISFPESDKFRVQTAHLELKIPVGKVVYLDLSAKGLIYDIKNVTNTYDGKMIGTMLFLTGFLAELVSRNSADRNHYLISKKIGLD